MFRPRFAALLALATSPSLLAAQHGGAAGEPLQTTAPAEARQYDFLVGAWDLTVKVPAAGLAQKIHGTPKLVGTWKAWRAFDGFGIEDELRITDAAGNPMSLSHAMRYYDRGAHNWGAATLDVFRNRVTTSSAEWKNGVMTSTARSSDPEGKPSLVRTRFSDITPTSFHWLQERSSDEGKSWNEGLRIEARRTAATAPR